MTEYDKKIKELNDLRQWFDEHVDEMTYRHDALVIIAPEYNDDEKMHVFSLGAQYQLTRYLIQALYDIEMRD